MTVNALIGFHIVIPEILKRCFIGTSVLKWFSSNENNLNYLRTHNLFMNFAFVFFVCGYVCGYVCANVTLHLIFGNRVSH